MNDAWTAWREYWKENVVRYLSLGQIERAIDDLDEYIRLYPQHAEAYSVRGVAYFLLATAWPESHRGDEYDGTGHFRIPRLSQARRGFELAIENYDEAIRLDPQDALAYHSRGTAYLLLRQIERAIEDYYEAIKLDPQYAWGYKAIGDAHVRLSQEAQHEWDTMSPEALTQETARQYQRAIENYDEAIRLDPKLAGAYHNRSVAYRLLGEPERAQQDFGEALRDPKYEAAYENRSWGSARFELPGRPIEQNIASEHKTGMDDSSLTEWLPFLKRENWLPALALGAVVVLFFLWMIWWGLQPPSDYEKYCRATGDCGDEPGDRYQRF
jgi:tetratricopeptide (TPR) repeat protein